MQDSHSGWGISRPEFSFYPHHPPQGDFTFITRENTSLVGTEYEWDGFPPFVMGGW